MNHRRGVYRELPLLPLYIMEAATTVIVTFENGVLQTRHYVDATKEVPEQTPEVCDDDGIASKYKKAVRSIN